MSLPILISLFALLALTVSAWLAWWFNARLRFRGSRSRHLRFDSAPETVRVIAHAGGGHPDGPYANAIECMDWWYANHVRYFEFDLRWTRDGQLVGLHDWGPSLESWYRLDALPWSTRIAGPLIRWRGLDAAEFARLPMRSGLTTLNPARLADWLAEHPDAWLVTDIKHDNIRALRQLARALGPLAQQVMAQIFAENEIPVARALGFGAVGWANYVPKLPIDQLPARLAGLDLDFVVVDDRTIRQPSSHAALQALHDRGLQVWVFTVNQQSRARALPPAVSGIITDCLLPRIPTLEGADRAQPPKE